MTTTDTAGAAAQKGKGSAAVGANIPTPEELIARARALVPVLAERAAADEARRSLSPESVAAFRDAGLMRVVQPKIWGGYEMSPSVFAEIQMTLAEGDMSAAWVYGVLTGHAYHLALFDPRAQEAVWGENRDAMIASAYAPTGKAKRVDGGYRFSGRWSFSSGSDHSDWIMLGGMTDDEQPQHLAFLINRSDLEIVDAWHVMGLKATGSQDVIVDDVFVPDYAALSHTNAMADSQPGQALNKGPLYAIPFMQLFYRSITTGNIGALQGMLDAFLAYGAAKIDKRGRALVDNPDAQLASGEAAVAIADLKAGLHRNYAILMEYAEKGLKPSVEERLRFRTEAAQAAGRCVAHARALFLTAGGHGIYDSKLPFGRILRNLEAAEAHPAAQARVFARSLGIYRLTGQLTDTMI